MRSTIIFRSALCGLAIAEIVGVLEGLGLLRSNAPRSAVEWAHAVALYGWLGLSSGLAIGLLLLLLPLRIEYRWRLLVGLLSASFLFVVAGYWINFAPWFPSFGTSVGKLWTLGFAGLVLAVALMLARWTPPWRVRMESSSRSLIGVLLLVVLPPIWYLRPVNPPVEMGSSSEGAPPVFLLLIDTLRKDHLSCYGYERETSPRIDELAGDGIRLSRSFTTGNYTLPSVATLMGGQFPSTHGILRPYQDLPAVPTLAERLSLAGYRSGAFVGNPTLKPERGFGRGFSEFFPPPLPRWCLYFKTAPELITSRLMSGPDTGDASVLVPRALRWLAEDSDRPPFLYLHLMEPHSGYVPPRRYFEEFLPEGVSDGPVQPPRVHDFDDSGDFLTWEELEHGAPIDAMQRAGMVARYDGEIRLVDEWVGGFLDQLRERELYDDALIILLADHGEEFDDHGGWFHGRSLYPEMIDMPLIVKLPGNAAAGSVSELSLDMIDLAPTLASLVGAAAADSWQGRDRAELLRSGEKDSLAVARFVERPPYLYGLKTLRWSAIKKVIRGEDSWMLFDRFADPLELMDVSTQHADTLAVFQARVDFLINALSSGGGGDESRTDPETERMLRSLGYVQ